MASLRRSRRHFLVSKADVRKERGERSPRQREPGLAQCQRQEGTVVMKEERRKEERGMKRGENQRLSYIKPMDLVTKFDFKQKRDIITFVV